MRIVAISDTHSMHAKTDKKGRPVVKIPDGDVLIHCGDALGHGELSELEHFADWLEKQPHQHKIVIAGNHDWCWEREPHASLKILGGRAHYLCDTLVEIDGITFYGSPWTPKFYNWAFMRNRGPKMREIWDTLCHCAETNPIDVLVTHGPPYGHGDNAPGARRAGCLELLRAVQEVKPRHHLFGHIHEGHGTSFSDEAPGVVFRNVSICTGRYKPTNLATVFDIDKR